MQRLGDEWKSFKNSWGGEDSCTKAAAMEQEGEVGLSTLGGGSFVV